MVQDFRMDCAMGYSSFVPRLYNLSLSLGFTKGKIMPSRALCSDESQGFPVILIAKHFGAFPFNHGRAGGVVATDRHGPHAHHGQDLVLIQASHVGYNPDTYEFGKYCRLQTPQHDHTETCGRIGQILKWYLEEYDFAKGHILIGREFDHYTVTIDNQLLDELRPEGLFIKVSALVEKFGDEFCETRMMSTSRVFKASAEFSEVLSKSGTFEKTSQKPIGEFLKPEWFEYQRNYDGHTDDYNQVERNLRSSMPWIVTSSAPMLVAAQINTIAEFDRTFRSIVKTSEYKGRNLLFISCLNIDISPKEGQVFPLTKCVPWAAYLQTSKGENRVIEQAELIEMLEQQAPENNDQIDLERAIALMSQESV